MLKVKKPTKPKKEVFRKNVIDFVLILPKTEGTITGGGLVTMRVPLDKTTNIEFMSGALRQAWVTLCREDSQLKKEFETYFKNQELDRKRMEKLAMKAQLKLTKAQKKAEQDLMDK